MRILEGHPFIKDSYNSTVENWTTGSGKYARRTRSAGVGAYTFVEVDATGHMVPYDQPEAALDMLERCVLLPGQMTGTRRSCGID
jgi:cathepsin A (carboxypeptidase C)